LLGFGLIAIITPFSAGGWAISILGPHRASRRCVGVIQGLQRNRRLRRRRPSSRACWCPSAGCCFSPGQSWWLTGSWTPRADHGSRRRHEDRGRAQRQARSGALVDNFQRSSITRPAGGSSQCGGGSSASMPGRPR